MFFIPFSQTGDDTVVNWITRGIGMVDKPSEFLLVVNIVLGILLKNLNLVFPRIPWFGLGLYSVFFFSVWALLAAFLSRERSPWAGFLFAVLGTPLFFHCYAWPQYTVYCLLAAQAGIFLLANPVRPYSFGFGLSAFLLVTASLIRLEPALFSLAAGAVYLLRSFRMEPETRINRNRLRVLSAVAILIVLCSGFNWFYASAHDGWKEAREYYDLRFSIGESKVSSYEHQAQAFQSVGWSPEDYRMFLSAFYALPTFNLENLKKLDGLLKVDFEVKRAVLSEMLKPTVVQFMLWSFGVCFVFGLMGKGKAWGSVSWVVLLVLFLVSYNKIVARVFWPQLLFADLLLVFLLPPGAFSPGKAI